MAGGENYSLNFPLQDGIDDETYQSLFQPVRVCVRFSLLTEPGALAADYACHGVLPAGRYRAPVRCRLAFRRPSWLLQPLAEG